MAVGCCITRFMIERPRWCCPQNCRGLLPPVRVDEGNDSQQELQEAFTAPNVVQSVLTEQLVEVDPTLHIQIGSLTGTHVRLAVQPTDSIERAKRMLYLETGIPPMEQRLLFNGDELTDDLTMEQGGVVDGSTIHMVLRMAAKTDAAYVEGSHKLDSSLPTQTAASTETKTL